MPGDTNGLPDIFLQDPATGEIIRLSTDSMGVQVNGASGMPVFSPDGTKLGFVSTASNLAPGDSGQVADVFVKDLSTGSVERIATGSGDVSIVFSPDGPKVVFASSRDDLVPGDTNYRFDVFLSDPATGAITRVSTGSAGEQLDGGAISGVWSPDGTKVAFVSYSYGSPWGWSVFVKNLATGQLERMTNGAEYPDTRFTPVFSPDAAPARPTPRQCGGGPLAPSRSRARRFHRHRCKK